MIKNPAAKVVHQAKILANVIRESRNKTAAASLVLEQMHELLGSSRPVEEIWNEMREMRGELAESIGLLREADQLVATRLQLSMIWEGSYESEKREVDAAREMNRVVSAEAAFAAPGVAFRVECPDGATLSIDTRVFGLVANHLLSNARRHTRQGEVVFGLKSALDDGRVAFFVRDTGEGISNTDALFQGTDKCTGLAACLAVLAAIGGEIRLEKTRVATKEDTKATTTKGFTEFSFSMPGDLAYYRPISSRGALPASLEVHVVEDSPLIRAGLVKKLRIVGRRAGVQVSICEHATAEAFVPHVATLKHRTDVLVTLDENLDAAGGLLRGRDVMAQLVAAGFRGLICSASGDDLADHKAAHIRWPKPYPPVATMLVHLNNVYAARAMSY